MAVDFLFTDFRFDPRLPCLYRVDKTGKNSPDEPIHLSDHALILLGLLIERRGDVVSHDDIFDRVWRVGPRDMDRSNIHERVFELRKVIGRPSIATAKARGYQFATNVTEFPRPDVPPDVSETQPVTALYGISPEQLQQLIKEAVSGAVARPPEEMDDLSNRLKVTQNAATEMLRIVGQANTPIER